MPWGDSLFIVGPLTGALSLGVCCFAAYCVYDHCRPARRPSGFTNGLEFDAQRAQHRARG
jgi:hypothetical protein